MAVFPILADVVEVKTVSRSTAHWRIRFIRLNGWLRHSFAQLITLLDIDGIGQNWEDSNTMISPPISLQLDPLSLSSIRVPRVVQEERALPRTC